MDVIEDFQDMLALLNKRGARYLIIGGLAFIYHAKPRYTKDMDLWIDPSQDNVQRANLALAEFGSPFLLDADKPNQITQLGVAPARIDLLLNVSGVRFETAWRKRERGQYGNAAANWIDLNTLIHIKRRVDSPRHQEDARVLLKVKERRARAGKAAPR